MSLHDEIFEQPQSLSRLLALRKEVLDAAEKIRQRNPAYVFLTARGTSDNAGRYANYLWGAFNRLPVALATPSLFTYYDQPPVLANALVVSVSQSGQSPDIISVVQEGRRQGCQTLAIVNAPESPLAKASEIVIDICAGPEKAVAATKSYTGQLTAIAMLAAALKNDDNLWSELSHLPDWVAAVLTKDEEIAQIARLYRYMEHCVVLGRGYNYATAFEWSLKMKELTYIVSEPYSSADFLHGPIAMVEQGFPVMGVAVQGKVLDTMIDLLRSLRRDRQVELLCISNDPHALALAQSPIELPAGIPEWLTPIVSIVAGQLFAYHLTRVRGFSTETPRNIHKVTETN